MLAGLFWGRRMGVVEGLASFAFLLPPHAARSRSTQTTLDYCYAPQDP